ncbi:hypothetical protein TNCV_3389511 [Trichonephila clavipes]|nr:hypothetical protein TNCV_3389511 [Trichonephila clavipes]
MRVTIARLRDKLERDLLRISIKTISKNHDYPPVPPESQKWFDQFPKESIRQSACETTVPKCCASCILKRAE